MVLQSFAQEWVSWLWSWDGTTPGTKEDDYGVKTATGVKVPIDTWVASLMMNSHFAMNFLNELSKQVPKGVYEGQYSSAVNFRYVSKPDRIAPGLWDVSLLSERIIFDEYNKKQLKPIPFNKTLRIRAVPIVHSPLKENANALEKTLYAMKAKGLEIETILDYNP